MMKNKNKVVKWTIGILIASNVFAISSFVIHAMHNKKCNATQENHTNKGKTGKIFKRNAPFKEDCPLNYLGLDDEQIKSFTVYRNDFIEFSDEIQKELKKRRLELLSELNKSEIDSVKVEQLTIEIGDLHAELKIRTVDLYLNVKNECTVEQQEKLYEIFIQLNK